MVVDKQQPGKLHQHLMRAADNTSNFFPVKIYNEPPSVRKRADSSPDPAPFDHDGSSTSSLDPRSRKLSTASAKLIKSKPTSKSTSTPPSAYKRGPITIVSQLPSSILSPRLPDGSDKSIEAVISNVDSIIATGAQRKMPASASIKKAMAERSFASSSPHSRQPSEETSFITPSTRRPSTDHTSSQSSSSSLRRSISSYDLDSSRRAEEAEAPDPFARNAAPYMPPHPNQGSTDGPGQAPGRPMSPTHLTSSHIFGTAITRYPGANGHIKRWTPPKSDNRDTVIALYKPPSPPDTSSTAEIRPVTLGEGSSTMSRSRSTPRMNQQSRSYSESIDPIRRRPSAPQSSYSRDGTAPSPSEARRPPLDPRDRSASAPTSSTSGATSKALNGTNLPFLRGKMCQNDARIPAITRPNFILRTL